VELLESLEETMPWIIRREILLKATDMIRGKECEMYQAAKVHYQQGI